MKYYEIKRKMTLLAHEAEEIPWDVWTTFWEQQPHVDISADHISFGGDFKTLREVRHSLDWLVKQMGGKVTWKK